jgi:hypothetical protein
MIASMDDGPGDPLDDLPGDAELLEDDDELDEAAEEEEGEVPLSAELRAELGSFVLIEDWDLSVSRAETLDVLADALQELEDDASTEEWVAEYGERDFHLAQERDGRLVISDVFPVAGVVGFIPKALVRLLTRELLAQAEEDREGWVESLSDLVSEWLSLLSDEEKMVGHLIRAHGLGAEDTDEDHAGLIARHAGLHAES